MLASRRWLPAAAGSGAQLRLYCFPHAGGMPHMFRGWPAQLPPSVEVVPILLPGRGTRLREPPHRRIGPLVDEVCEALWSHAHERPFALFGHSMGAIVAFELARALRARGGPSPVHVFVSAHRAPDAPRRRRPIHRLNDPGFLEALVRMNGTPREVAAHPEVMAVMMPMLRADFEAIETYAYVPDRPLDCPITAFAGAEDPMVGPPHLEGWRRQTTSRFALHVVPGDHFFVNTHQRAVLAALAAELRQDVDRVAASS